MPNWLVSEKSVVSNVNIATGTRGFVYQALVCGGTFSRTNNCLIMTTCIRQRHCIYKGQYLIYDINLQSTRMHSSRMRTARNSSRRGGLLPGGSPPVTPPGADTPPTRHTPRADPPSRSRHPPPVDRTPIQSTVCTRRSVVPISP